MDQANIISLPLAGDVRRALDRLQSLHDGELGVLDITACGQRAVPALRALLLEGRSSGIYQPRCRAVEALAALGRYDVLIEFLRSPREVADPIDRTGEDAVINAAARASSVLGDEPTLRLLEQLASGRMLAGVIDALGSFERAEAIPHLIRALAEDHTRAAAEAGLLRLGSKARPALRKLAMRPLPSPEGESTSSVRTRRSAVRLLGEIGAPVEILRLLAEDTDPELAAAACIAALSVAKGEAETVAVRRLLELLPRLPWIACADVEQWLAVHFVSVVKILARSARQGTPIPTDERTYRTLMRIARQAGAELP